MKKHLLASTALIAGSLLAVSAQAEAEFYGQVNKALVWADDGSNERVQVGDNEMSSTRFGFRGEQEIGNGLTASFLLEMETTDSDNTRSLTVDGNVAAGTQTDAASSIASSFNERHARVGLSGSFGSAFLGRTSSATDGITEIDLGSVSDLMGSDVTAIGGSIDDAGAGDNFGDFYSNLEGFDDQDEDRVNLVRYDSPIYNGFQASVAVANGGDADVALRYGAKFGATEVKAGIGYANFNQFAAPAVGGSVDQWSGSVSAKHDSGLNGTFAYGERDIDGAANSPEFMYVKAGYDMGNWGFAVDYAQGEELAAVNEEAEAMGIGAQYNFGNGVSAGVLYREFQFDTAANNDDVKLLATSLRVKF